VKGDMAKEKVKNQRKLYADDDVRNVYTPHGNPENARVDPSFAEDSQIQNMLLKFSRGEISAREPFYGDATEYGDFRALQERVLQIRNEFEKLPSAIRKLADNDPSKLAGVLADPDNEGILHKHGIRKKKLGDREAAPSAEPERQSRKEASQEASNKVEPQGETKTQSVDNKKNKKFFEPASQATFPLKGSLN